MHLMIWSAASILAALVFLRSPRIVICLFVWLRILVPASAGPFITGDWIGSVALHPASFLFFAFFILWLPANVHLVRIEVQRRRGFYLGLLGLCLFFALLTVFRRGPSALAGYMNVFLIPSLVLLVVRSRIHVDPKSFSSIAKVVFGAVVVEVVLVIVQVYSDSSVVWAGHHLNPWSRPWGTFDSPLDLAFFAVLAIPLASGLRSLWGQLAIAWFAVLIVALSQSRLPSVAAAAGVLWLSGFAARGVGRRVSSVALMFVAVLLASSYGLFAGVLDRFSGDDGNSAAGRSAAYVYLREHLFDHLFFGGGWGSTGWLKGSVLQTSLESGYGIFALDMGVLGVSLLLTLQLRDVACGRGGYRGARVALLLGILLGFAFSGFTTMSATAVLLWLVWAISDGAVTWPAVADELRSVGVESLEGSRS